VADFHKLGLDIRTKGSAKNAKKHEKRKTKYEGQKLFY
jgi:hypothetical protein